MNLVRPLLSAFALLAVVAVLAAPASAQDAGGAPSSAYAGLPADALRPAPWSEAALHLAERLPVQDGGRVKPLSTLAGFTLLRANGKRKLTVPTADGGEERIGPTAWLLDALFFPDQAERYRHFLVRDDAVLTAIGVEVEGRKRSDRYSYAELLPGRGLLMEEAERIDGLEAKARSPLELQLLNLASNVRGFEDLTNTLEFARADLPLDASPGLRERFGGRRPGVTQLYPELPALRELWDAAAVGELGPDRSREELAAAQRLMEAFGAAVDRARFGPALLPPTGSTTEAPEWLDAGDALVAAVDAPRPEADLDLLARFERLEAAKRDPGRFEAELEAFLGEVRARAEARGEYGKIPLEIAFYDANFFVRALVFFLLAFVAVALSWLLPWRGLVAATWLALGAGELLLVGGIVVRCILRERPPVSTLYETILFIAAVGVATAMAIEWINRRRVALPIATVIGAAGMFLSLKYELKEAATAGDTMPALQAVLDTNFWLATHVTTVTMGYAAGLLAAALAHVWIFGKLFGLKRHDPGFYASLTRMVYGVVAFGLVFATVGTILGGVWANYSWGRFWGWDPKENGALMIVLWMLVIVHARLGGYVRQFGINVLAVLLGPVVAFSWWGVNQLAVGLHSYGFTDGVSTALNSYYLATALVVSAAGIWHFTAGRNASPGGGAAG